MKRKQPHRLIAGVDEVGRGPLAGPVVAAAVILDLTQPIDGLTDSKLLSAKQREVLAEKIKAHALAYSFGRAEVAEIDRINIFQASLLAMQRAVMGLSLKPAHVLIDGQHCPDLPYSCQAIIQGDKTEPAISAASIIAKVLRDHEMQDWDRQYPQYGFAQHKGYATAQHVAAIKTYGVVDIHRRSFAPVKAQLEKAGV